MQLEIYQADDWHLHIRDGAAMAAIVSYTARQCARAIIMPNLKPPVTTVEQALAYRQRILAAVDKELTFNPLMTLYLTDNTSPQEIVNVSECQHVVAVKYYPAGATTNSDAGVTKLQNVYDTIGAMEKYAIPLLVHGEVTNPDVDIFDREKVFIDTVLTQIIKQFPALRIVFEHITTKDAVDFVLGSGANVAATITPHHLLLNRNAMLVGGIYPHHYCLPVLKREYHRNALVDAAISGNPKFFLGTDSAPHAQFKKETACGCAGIFSAHAALELYATVFEQAHALDKLEAFASFHGPDFYRLPRNTKKITLRKQSWQVPSIIEFGADKLIPFYAGQTINWQLVT